MSHLNSKRFMAALGRLAFAVPIATTMALVTPGTTLAQEEEVEEIVVTGSRLVRRDLDAPSPVVVIDSNMVENSGNVTLEETLNEMPQLASDNTSSVNSGGGSGILTADLRGLDAVRTLVLVNGKRFAPSDSRGLTDISSIPDALVERVEVLTGGASAVYGSDAIAGAVNFVLKDDFEGLDARYYLGETDKGDATTQKFDLTLGGNFDRGNAVVSASYTDRGNIFFADRDYSATSLFESGGALVPGGSSNLPGTRVSLSSAGLGALDLPFDPATACGSDGIGGIRFGEQGAVEPFCDPTDRYNFAPLNYLLRPMERVQITGIGHYDLNDWATAYTELYFMDNRNEWQQAPNAGGLQTSGAPRGTYLIPDFANNPVLFDATREFLVDNAAVFDADGDGTAEIIQTGRRSVETGPRNYKYDRVTYNALAGVKGDFEAANRQWNYDAFFQYQRAKTDEDIAGQLSNLRVALASDVTVDASDPNNPVARCTNEFVGCVPANFLGLNSLTPEAAAFISPNHGVTNVLERQVYGGFISGDLFEMPAGPLAFGIGFEERKDSYDFRPDTAAQGGEFGDPQPPISEQIEITEFFAEARIPLLSGVRFAEVLALEVAARSSDYSTIGQATTWKLGAEWAPTDWLRFRGSFNQAIRSPNLDELFSTVAIGFSAGDDRCDQDFNPSDAVKALCVQQGVLASEIDTFNQTNVGFGVRSGGNDALEEEKADTFTIGFVATLFDSLNITMDYYQIEIDNAINQLTAQQVVDNCFRELDNSTSTCQAINRFQNGQIDFVDARSLNLASITASGVDLMLDYSLDLGNTLALFGPAQMNFNFYGNWALENEKVAEPGQPGLDCLGKFGGSCSGFNTFIQPDAKYIVSADYVTGDFFSRLQWRHIPSLSLFEGAGNVVESASSTNYLDLNFDYTFGERYTLFLGIDNITDEEPPIFGFSLAGDANVDISLFDVLGRRYYGGIRIRL